MARILVIDDDVKICSVFERCLSRCDHVVEVASDGRDGLRMLEAGPPDLVITDIMMPVVDGLEIIMTVREKYPHVKVIAVSGGMHDMPMDFLTLAKKFGADGVLHKPVLLNGLIEAVNEVLEV